MPFRTACGLALCLLAVTILTASSCRRQENGAGNVVRFVTWKPNAPRAWEEVLALFVAEHPDIKVIQEIGPHSSSAFHDLLSQKLKNKSPDVDVFLMDVTWPPEFGSAGWALPLDDRFPEREREAFIPGSIRANTSGGHLYGLPLYIDGGMLYYRSDLLERYGFHPPLTWEEMVRQAMRIVEGEKAAGTLMYGFSGQFKQYEGLVCNMLEYILSNRGAILDEPGRKSVLHLRPAVEAVTFVRDRIIGAAASRGVLTYQEPESLALFIQGKAVFLRNWPYAWALANDPELSTVAGKVGIAPLPHFPGGESRSTLGGWQVGVSSYSRNKEAARTFAGFLAGRKAQRILALKAGLLPSRLALYDDPDLLAAHPQFSRLKEVLLTVSPRPGSPLYPAISNILQRYFSIAIAEKDSDVEREAQAASREIDRTLSILPPVGK